MSAPPSPSREELLRENAELRTRLAQAEEGQQLLEALLQHVPEGITIAKAPDLRVCLKSRHGRQLLGGGEADPAAGETGTKWLVFQAGRESPLGDDELPLARAIRNGETVRDQELVWIDPQGRRLWLLCSAAPIRDGEGRIVAGIEVWSDITARKAAGEALARQREELQAIFDALPASVFVKDRSNRILRANQVFADSLGLPRAQIENRSTFDLFPAEQATAFWRDDLEVIASGQPKTNILESTRPRSEDRWALTNKIPYRDAQGEVAGVIGFALDITERKRAEDALRQSEERLHQALLVGRMFVFEWDARTDAVVRSPGSAEILGLQQDATTGMGRDYFQWIHPEDREKFHATLARISPTADTFRITYRVTLPKGSCLVLDEIARGLFDASGQLLRLVGISVDVTQARAAELQLRVLTRAMEAGPAGVVITDPQGVITYVNPAFAQLTGYTADQMLGQTPRRWRSGLHPAAYYEGLRKALSQGEAWRGEFCNRKQNGELFWNYATIAPVKDDAGRIAHLVAVMVDITERKYFEEALYQARADLERQVEDRTTHLNQTILALHQEVAARRRAEAEIEERLRFERLIAEISADFASPRPGRFAAVLQDGIRRLMHFLKAEWATLAELEEEGARLSLACSASAGPPPIQGLAASEFPETLRRLRSGQVISFSPSAGAPGSSSPEVAAWNRWGVGALLAVPLTIGQEVIGALLFANVRLQQPFTDPAMQRMRLVQDLFAGQLLQWRSEKALGAAEARFDALADFMRDWEYWKSPAGDLLFCSPACERITGYGPQRFLVEPSLINKIVLPEDAALWREHRRETRTRFGPHQLQFRIRRADGEVRWIDHNCQPVMDEGGTFLGLRGSNRDVTAAKHAELETQRLRENLARITRTTTLDQLAASLAHELRQPLTAILSNAEAAERFLAMKPPEIGEVSEALQDIIINGERAGQVISRLRELCRKAGQERTRLAVNQLIEDTLALLRSELILRQVSCRLELAPGLPEVAADRIQLQQVLMNLILNGMDAMQAREPGVRELVITTGAQAPGEIQTSVADAGTGIQPESASHLFEPFFTTKESGMGMGLAICQAIIATHGGRLWGENNPGPGATFHFTVPVASDPSL